MLAPLINWPRVSGSIQYTTYLEYYDFQYLGFATTEFENVDEMISKEPMIPSQIHR